MVPKPEIARQYCFKASASIYNQHRVFGTFVAYGKTMEISKNVENACKICLQDSDLFPECVWDDVEIVVYDVCPVECSAKVQFIPHAQDFCKE